MGCEGRKGIERNKGDSRGGAGRRERESRECCREKRYVNGNWIGEVR